uniref:RanBD1 domain-containing protein n=1 Tax=Panagrellus redivivus TaxID=6233 RepID=A0A7E4ZRS3_PANRE
MSAAKQFQEKLTILNSEFVDFVKGALEENPAYDLSPSVKDYIDHVKELDQVYSEQKIGERKVINAVRRNAPQEKPNPLPRPVKPTPSVVTAPPKEVGNGQVEPPGQFPGLPKITMPKMPEKSSSTFSAPKLVGSTTTSNASTCGSSRKRRQEAALDYDEMKSTKSSDYGKSKPTEVSPPKLSAGLAAFSAKLQAEKTGDKPASSLFASSGGDKSAPVLFGSTSTDKPASSLFAPTSSDKPASSLFGSAAGTPPASLFAFGAKKDDSAASDGSPKPPGLFTFGSASGDASKNTLSVPKPFAFEGRPSDSSSPSDKPSESPKPAGLFTFGAKPSSTFKPAAAPPSLFGTTTAAAAKEAAFGPLTFGAKKDDTSSTTAPSLFGTKPTTGLNPLLGGLKPPTTGGGLFASMPVPKPAESTPAAEGEEAGEEDAPPPKPEVVEHEEKDAVFNTKCSMFTFSGGEYKKTGVGQLYIKPSEKGTNLLIRAATTIGTVWVNTIVDEHFKASKKSKDKIQASFPTPEGSKTVLIRVNEKDTEAIADYLIGGKKA